jgi:hypothetical protein
MKAIKNIILMTLIICGIVSLGQSQINVSGIVNAYYPVTAISGNTITVGTRTGATHTLAVGDKVLLIQMTGNTAANGGKFEYANVTAVSGSSVTVDVINRAYSPSTEKVQLVWVPYDATSITVTGKTYARNWNGRTGGIVALLTPGTLILNDSITANGAGFRYIDTTKTIFGSDIWYGGGGGVSFGGTGGGGGGYGEFGSGGHSITPNVSTDTIYSGEDGTYNGGWGGGFDDPDYFGGGGGGGGGVGSAGSGGGGGYHAGGGGGGAGLSVGGCGGQGADNGGAGGMGHVGATLDTDGVDGVGYGPGNYPSSGGGGGGGVYVGGGGGVYPYDGTCVDNGGKAGSNGGTGGGSTCTNVHGGHGGGVVPPSGYHIYQSCDGSGNCLDPRVWMGGGGQNTSYGGGIILIKAETLVSNNNVMSANGNDGVQLQSIVDNSRPIGGGGGGGGGIVALNVHSITSGSLKICAKGGNGFQGQDNGYHGGGSGGAGGGGVIWVNDPQGGIGSNTLGTPPAIANIVYCIEGALAGPQSLNPKNASFTGTGGCGGSGVVQVNNNCSVFEICTASCTISSITATPSSCTPGSTMYSVTGQVTFTDAPATGTLTVSVGSVTQIFNAPFTSPQTYTISGLTSDGASHTVTAVFSADAACTATQTYTAPASCQCVISALTAVPGTCNSNNNAYTLTGQVTFTNAPASGTLVITVTGGNSVTLNSPFTSPLSYSIANLNADGASHTVTATFSNNIMCTLSQTYSSPAQCSTPCPPSSFDFCGGDTYTLTAPAGYTSYQWYTVVGTTETPIPGATTNVYIATMPGTYIYHATDAGNCPIELCCPVTLNDVRPLLSCTATTTPGCGQSNGSRWSRWYDTK